MTGTARANVTYRSWRGLQWIWGNCQRPLKSPFSTRIFPLWKAAVRAPGEGQDQHVCVCACCRGGSSPEGNSGCRNISTNVEFEFMQSRAPPALRAWGFLLREAVCSLQTWARVVQGLSRQKCKQRGMLRGWSCVSLHFKPTRQLKHVWRVPNSSMPAQLDKAELLLHPRLFTLCSRSSICSWKTLTNQHTLGPAPCKNLSGGTEQSGEEGCVSPVDIASPNHKTCNNQSIKSL